MSRFECANAPGITWLDKWGEIWTEKHDIGGLVFDEAAFEIVKCKKLERCGDFVVAFFGLSPYDSWIVQTYG